jgi:small conductance mechanosensitive channel
MDSVISTSAVGSFAALAWSWTIVFAPRVVAAVVIVVIGLLLSRWIRRLITGVNKRSKRLDPTLEPVLLAAIQYSIIIVMVLLVLNQLGIQTTSLIALLGAAGLAVGLALQGTLSNIAAGIMLLWLRPFKLGDYIEVNNMSGVIEETGLFVCTIRTYDGARIFAPNSTIWNFSLRNHSRAERRMIAVSVTVAGDGEGASRQALMGAMHASPEALETPSPTVFLDEATDTNATLTCRFWTSHADYGRAQRDVVEALRSGLMTAGVPAEEIQLIARITPAPTDPSRLIDL